MKEKKCLIKEMEKENFFMQMGIIQINKLWMRSILAIKDPSEQ